MKNFKKENIITTYFKYQDTYTKKLGNDVIVCMQVGAFYEMYYYDSPHNKKNKDIMTQIIELTNLQTSKKTGTDYYMAGFQLDNEEKYFTKILQANISIVTVVQESSGSNPVRKVSGVLSPSTDLTYTIHKNRTMTASIYLYATPQLGNSYKPRIFAGISLFDTKTGESYLYETKTPKQSNNITYPLEECIRILDTYVPGEIIITISNKSSLPYLELKNVLSFLGCNGDSRGKLYTNTSTSQTQFYEHSVRNIFFSELFQNNTMINIDEYLHIQNKEEVAISYAILLHHIQIHNMRLIDELELPTFIEDEENLLLTTNSTKQLNLISSDTYQSSIKSRHKRLNSLLDVVDKTKTIMGKRDLHSRLLQPIVNSQKLEDRYNIIDFFLENKKYNTVRNVLELLQYDIQVLQRKMNIRNLTPNEFSNYAICYKNIQTILKDKIVKTVPFYPNNETINVLTTLIQDIDTNFIIDKIPSSYQETFFCNFVKKGVYEELDTMERKIENRSRLIEEFGCVLSKLIDIGDKNCMKLENNCYVTTKKRGESMIQKLKNYGTQGKITVTYYEKDASNTSQKKSIQISVNQIITKPVRSKSNIQIYCEHIDTMIAKNVHARDILCKKNYEHLEHKIQEYRVYHKSLLRVIDFISKLDVNSTIAYISDLYGYTRPQIQMKYDNSSFVNIKGIRHPIIERICNHNYVKNDLYLDSETQEGILLFGVNATGKSSLMKALGLCIIMAQSGFYVPCDVMIYQPYSQLFTRILNHDNLFMGKSSFEVEMNELRTIAYRVKPKSLILGDELCSGTEKDSAVGIFTASVQYIQKRGGHFIFATHLHDLKNQTEIVSNTMVHMYHLSVEYDSTQQILVYDRKLKKGSGSKNYGIEVCKALQLPDEIISKAMEIRKRNNENNYEFSQSQYNSNIVLGKMCDVCKKEPSVDAHHIYFQSTANDCGLIDTHLQKNSESNLVSLCKTCHNHVHYSKRLLIHGWNLTSRGRKLNYEFKEENTPENTKSVNVGIKKKRKFDSVVVNRINELNALNHKPAKIVQLLKMDDPTLRIGKVSVQKIINNEYE